jgi:hypothetical protein
MKKLVIIFILFVCQKTYSQEVTRFQKQIDSLKAIKSDYEYKIKEVNILINQIEIKKSLTEFERFESILYIVQGHQPMKIRNRDESSGKILFRPKEGETIKLIDYNDNNDYWLVSYNNSVGYVSEVYIEESPAIDDYKKYLIVKKAQTEAQKAAERRILEAQESEEREKIRTREAEERVRYAQQIAADKNKEMIKKYGSEVGKRIIQDRVWLGMTDEMARDSFGIPDKNNRTSGSWGVYEQWIYDVENIYLYFEDGILESWQDLNKIHIY